MAQAGFVDIAVAVNGNSAAFVANWLPGSGAEDFVAGADVTAVKPVEVVRRKDFGHSYDEITTHVETGRR